MSAATTARRGRLCLVSSRRVSHFGAKPVRGGRPPRERSTRGVSTISRGVLAEEEASALILRVVFQLRMRNRAIVKMKYVKRARRARGVENCKISTTQPRWAIEE